MLSGKKHLISIEKNLFLNHGIYRIIVLDKLQNEKNNCIIGKRHFKRKRLCLKHEHIDRMKRIWRFGNKKLQLPQFNGGIFSKE